MRVWLELTDDARARWSCAPTEFDRKGEVKIALPKYQQAVVDSEFLWHGGYPQLDHTRYAVIVSVESGPELERWIQSQLPPSDGRDATCAAAAPHDRPGAACRRRP